MPDKKITVLVTGGAGYIGSHAVLALREAGHGVVVIDDLSTGVRDLVAEGVPLVTADVGDGAVVGAVLADHDVSAVMHFAGSVVVPESVTKPLDYYRNNTAATRTLIEACVVAGIDRFLFSSTAAVYGVPEAIPVTEDAPTVPINPYGWSKLMSERIFKDAAAAHGLSYAILRYFNVAGADPQGRSGQSTPNATHLIKIAAEVAVGRRERVAIFGEDYETPDGTGVRDYIHVSDLCSAHVIALDHLLGGGESLTLNCGYGRGYSVREVLDAVGSEAGRPLAVASAPRRPGDPPALIANADRIRERLGWRPRHDQLSTIVRTAIAWERHPMRQRERARVTG